MNERAKIAQVESALFRGAEDYFREHGFVHIPTVPHIVGITGACENVDTLFGFEYFQRQAYLTQTGQLALELKIPELKKVCCMIHSFRAEPENDSRHLTEFPLLELEFAYEQDGMQELLYHVEGTVKAMMVGAATDPALEELADHRAVLAMASAPFARMKYEEAIGVLQEEGYEIGFGDDLKHRHEMAILSFTGKPTFVTHYPEPIKFFNMRRSRADSRVVDSADLLLPYSGESVGSAVREEDPDLLEQKLVDGPMYANHVARGGSLEEFRWYLDAVRKKSVPHAGCGIGLSRVAQSVLGREDIRQSTAYAMNCATDLDRL